MGFSVRIPIWPDIRIDKFFLPCRGFCPPSVQISTFWVLSSSFLGHNIPPLRGKPRRKIPKTGPSPNPGPPGSHSKTSCASFRPNNVPTEYATLPSPARLGYTGPSAARSCCPTLIRKEVACLFSHSISSLKKTYLDHLNWQLTHCFRSREPPPSISPCP